MARRRVRLHYIANESSRKTTFRKRKKSLLKKVDEISTLCDIKAAAIIYSPFDSEPEVFPSHPEVRQLLTRFRDMPEMDKTRKMVDQETFLRQRIDKAREQTKKVKRENRDKEISQIMFSCLKGKSVFDLEMRDLHDLYFIIERNLMELEIKKQDKQEKNQENKLNLVEAVPAAAELGRMMRSVFGEGTSRGMEYEADAVPNDANVVPNDAGYGLDIVAATNVFKGDLEASPGRAPV
ncbi:agamous-like MADS-box protein AGL80 [Rosa rugosa]|uniref:agamous-like MADS-box protein AGL80 n=1 Tax=Rosa rugosa TaxID=74645 RepID=UPI002B40CA05|nr:agamous-like MADS-box protein AGL80 [Rosa rugosa]